MTRRSSSRFFQRTLRAIFLVPIGAHSQGSRGDAEARRTSEERTDDANARPIANGDSEAIVPGEHPQRFAAR
jgi:hypothetical protein